MYTVNELEEISGFTRRTIGDYVAKGLLAGPSHRGRGARYSQSDADVLRVIPRLRTLMKKEFPSLREVHEFLSYLSTHDFHSLARKTSECAFVHEVRNLRVGILLAAVLPQVPPERLTHALEQLTPEQIRGVDTGRHQLGAVIDLAELLRSLESDTSLSNKEKPVNGNGRSSRSVNWLAGSSYNDGTEFAAEGEDMAALESITQRLENMASDSEMKKGNPTEGVNITADRLSDIAERVERLERLMAVK